MKVGKTGHVHMGMTLQVLRQIEQELGVYFDNPVNVLRTGSQQFGVYDEDGVHAGDICANGMYFFPDELKEKTFRLFPQQP